MSSNLTEQVEKVKKRMQKSGPTVVLAYIQEHPNDVYTIADLATKVGLKYGTVKKYAHELAEEENIYRFRVRGQGSHYGTREALQQFQSKLEEEGLGGRFVGGKRKKPKAA
jgi:ribosomal protein L16/L10AE